MNSDTKIKAENQNKTRVFKALGTMSNDLSRTFYLFIKRTFDIICGLFGTILFFPVALIIKICYTMTR